MKKQHIIFTLLACLVIQTGLLASATRPRGHQYYVRHSKHHKPHQLHKPHGVIDATYH